MRIHSDILTEQQLYAALPPGVSLECMQKGSRSRARAFEVGLEWPGGKVKGNGRYRRNRNIGGSGFEEPYAATWDEWGIWLAALYEIDPNMKATYYENRTDFYEKTRQAFEWTKDKGAMAPWLSA